jgi:tetratricopeptide (TPR) repeat protein
VTGRAREALPLFEHAAAEAKTLGDFALATSATLYIGAARFALGQLAEAEESFRRVIDALGDAAGEKLGLHGLPLVFAESGLTALLAEQGRFEEARLHGAASIRIAESLNHAYTLVFALRTLGHAYTVEGRLNDAVATLERGRKLCHDADVLALAPNIMASLGYAYSLAGRAVDGVRLLEHALAALEEYGQRVWYSVMLYQLAESHLLAGAVGRAAEYGRRALSVAQERGERGFEAWALRMLAAVAMSGISPDPETGREHYLASLALAEERVMRPLVAQCHAGLAAVHRARGDDARAAEHRAAALAICRVIGLPPPPRLAEA